VKWGSTGAVTGYFCCVGGPESEAFLRAPDGAVTVFNAPGALATFPQAIDPAGAITGEYDDANFASHGFLRLP
jgi:hypothetical protein